ncbi:MAG: hypothetical protein ACOY94_16050 [Bacillota bacterium]
MDQNQITNDQVRIPHRRLTNAEWDALFHDVYDEVRSFYRKPSDAAPSPLADREAEAAVESLEIERESAHTVLSYLAGQRSGLRLGIRLAMMALSGQNALQLAVAMTDDEQADQLIEALLDQAE